MAKKLKPSSSLLDALRFVGSILKAEGTVNETHVLLKDNHAVAFNGVLAAGCKIQEDICCAPNNKLLIDALSKCGDNLSITQIDQSRLSIKSDKFKAIVPCINPELLTVAIPNSSIAPIDDKFKTAIEAVGVLANENADNVVAASILMNGQSVIATNRVVIFEAWHGLDLPPGLALPKAIVAPLNNSKKLAKFGFSKSSATFYFEDESWIKTQLYAGVWPDLKGILDGDCKPLVVPNDFWKALEAVTPFTPDGLVHFENNRLQSHPSDGVGASYEVKVLLKGPIFNAKQLKLIQPYAKEIDFSAPARNGTMLKFFGESIRGAIAGRSS
jgi:hypothetical protein